MENDIKKEINPVTLGLILFQAVFTIIMVVAYQNVFKYEPIKVGETLGEIEQGMNNLTEEEMGNINYHLYNAITASGAKDDLGKTKMTIREDTLIKSYDEENDVHYVNFIVDLPDLKQSYQAYHVWSDDVMNPYVSPNDSTGVICLKSDQLIYGEFNCEDTYPNMRNLLVGRFLEKNSYVIGDKNLVANVDGSFQTGQLKFRVRYLTCDSQCECLPVSESEKQAAIDKFREFVNGLGFRLEDLDYQFDNCQ